MSEFFRGWKRKVSLLALVLACVLAAGWLRSQKTYEFIALYDKSNSGVYTSIISMRGYITVSREQHTGGRRLPLYEQFPTSENTVCSGLIIVPYGWTAIALMSISTWLLLSKPPRVKRASPPDSKD